MPPKYSLPEIERRWLVDLGEVNLDALGEPEVIEDRYLTGTRLRLRKMSGPSGLVFKLVKKYGRTGWVEPITNLYLEPAEYDAVSMIPALTLTKRRFRLGQGTLDVFETFAIFEMEFKSIESAVSYIPEVSAIRELGESELTGAQIAAGVRP